MRSTSSCRARPRARRSVTTGCVSRHSSCSRRTTPNDGVTVTTVFIRHRVADFDTWKAAFDEHGTVRREHGLVDNGLLRDEDDANMVTIQMDTDDTARARAFLSS